MCCGDHSEPELAAAAPGGEAVMARAFTTTKGAVVRIGNHGEATNTVPCEVPEDVALELEAYGSTFRIERDAPAVQTSAKAPVKKSPDKGGEE